MALRGPWKPHQKGLELCILTRAVASLPPRGPPRASEYLAPQTVEGEVREG